MKKTLAILGLLVGVIAWMALRQNNRTAFDAPAIPTADSSASLDTKATITSSNCAANIEKLRQAGLIEMAVRRDAAISAGASKVKAEADYQAELKVAAQQLEFVKDNCKEE